MHRRFHHFHKISLGLVAGSLVFAISCTSNEDSASAPGQQGSPVPERTATVEPAVRSSEPAIRQPWPGRQPVVQSDWIKNRLNAVKQIFKFTPEGEEWIDGYDLRQMEEQPAWFGSFGYNSWAGVGEAVPRSVLHEISHSYWGAFSVEGRPDLSWDTSNGTSEALTAFRHDLDAFMLQPPDRFEPLRDRFRNLPNLNNGDYPDLFHFGEADLLYMAGGNFELIPPSLRPYVSGYLAEGGVSAGNQQSLQSWDVAIAWFNSLDPEDRRIAGELFGMQHFPLDQYSGLPATDHSGLDQLARTLYEGEERQRLIDFAEQFDGILDREFSLLDAVGADRGFDFWRGYLSDKLALHQRYPGVLTATESMRGAELSSALDFYAEISRNTAEEQVELFKASSSEPQISELAVLLKPQAIVELFSEDSADSGIAVVLGSRADRLTALVEIVEEVDRIDSDSSGGSAAAASEFERFMRSIPEDQLRADIFLLLELLRSPDGQLARRVLPALSDDALRFLLDVQPAAARSFEITPERLLAAVGIDDGTSLNQVSEGAAVLAARSSGNFAIDAPYDAAVFAQLDRFVTSDPAGVIRAIGESDTRLVPWISRESDGALVAMREEPVVAAELMAGLTGSRETPWRIVHLVAREDPELAAVLTTEMHRQAPQTASGSLIDDTVGRAIRHFGYDAYWSSRNAGPNVEPESLADYLLALRELLGESLLEEAVRGVLVELELEMQAGTIEGEAEAEFLRTFSAAIESQSGESAAFLESLRGGSVASE